MIIDPQRVYDVGCFKSHAPQSPSSGKIRMKNIFSELLLLSGYRSKKRLEGLPLSISYFYNTGCMWSVTVEEKQKSKIDKWSALFIFLLVSRVN